MKSRTPIIIISLLLSVFLLSALVWMSSSAAPGKLDIPPEETGTPKPGQPTGLKAIDDETIKFDGPVNRELGSPASPNAAGWVTVMEENFEGTFPGQWNVFDNNGSTGGEYYWAKRNCRPYQGSYSGWAVGGGANGSSLSCGSNFPNDAESWMIYGPFSLADATDGVLDYSMWLNTDDSGGDFIYIGASVDGSNFSLVEGWYGSTGGWVDESASLADWLGEPEVWISFIFVSDDANTLPEGLYLDNISLSKYIPTTTTDTPTPTATRTPTPTATGSPPPSDWINLMTEDFESDFPYQWTVFDDNGPEYGEYQWGKRNCRPYQGSYSGWGVGGGGNGSTLVCGDKFPTNTDSWMMYGPFSLEEAIDGELRFMLWLNTDLDSAGDEFFYGASLDGTEYWGTIYQGSSDWFEVVFDLTDVYNLGNLMGESEVWIAFVFESDGNSGDDLAEGAYVDNIVLRVKRSGSTNPISEFYLPLSIKASGFYEGPWEEEPNNSFAQANGNLRSGRTYYGYHNDAADYFKFNVLNPGQVTINFDSQHTLMVGGYSVVQIQLKNEQGDRLEYKVGPDSQISLSLNPGEYYVYIYTRVDYTDASKQYQVVVTYP